MDNLLRSNTSPTGASSSDESSKKKESAKRLRMSDTEGVIGLICLRSRARNSGSWMVSKTFWVMWGTCSRVYF